MNQLNSEVIRLREERQTQYDELKSLKGTVRSLEDTITSLQDQLEANKVLFAECSRELRAMKPEDPYDPDEIPKLDLRISELEAAALEGVKIKELGREVRLRFLESHRRYNMSSKSTSTPESVDRIKAGNRAAHRGRPVADALLCVKGEFPDRAVYKDLYGVAPEDMAPRDLKGKHRGKGYCDVPDMVRVTGFRASLKSEKACTSEFEDYFKKIIAELPKYDTTDKLRRALNEDKRLVYIQDKLAECFDKIVEKKQLQKRMGS